MAEIFVSYSRNDGVFTRKLVKSLRRLGLRVWFDVDEVQAGKNWSRVVAEALDAATVMLLIISPDAMQSPNVENEWQHFFDHKKMIIPILYLPAEINFQIGRIQYIDFFTAPFANALNQLTIALQNNGFLTLVVDTPDATARQLKAAHAQTEEPPKDDTSTESRSVKMMSLLDHYISMRRSGEYTTEAISLLLEPEYDKLTQGDQQAFIEQAKKWEENRTERSTNPLKGRDRVQCPHPNCGAFNPRVARYCYKCNGRLDDATPPKLSSNTPLNGKVKCVLMLTVMGQLIEVGFNDTVILGRSSRNQQITYLVDEDTDEEICFVNLEAYRAESKGVSRQHVSLKLKGRALTIKDMGSTNHSYLGEQWLMPDVIQTLIDGDVIRLASLELRVNYRFNE